MAKKPGIMVGALSADRFALNICAIVGDVLVRQRCGESTRYEIDLPEDVTGDDVLSIEPSVPAILLRDGSVFSWIAESWRPVASVLGPEAFERLAANGVRPKTGATR